jgi:hypothetical protein
MPGLVPGIHVFQRVEGVDGRDKPGHDGEGLALRVKLGVIPGERSEGRGSRAG